MQKVLSHNISDIIMICIYNSGGNSSSMCIVRGGVTFITQMSSVAISYTVIIIMQNWHLSNTQQKKSRT